MALVARRRVTERDVIRRLGFLEVRGMARIARRGHDLKSAVGLVLVACVAIYRSVCPGQGKAVIVLLNILDRHLPPAHAVALLAIRTELTFVNIGVAVLTVRADVAEHGLGMALRARDVLVKAAQWITSLIMIEFWNGADRLPAVRGVTVLAGNIKIAVWTISSRRALVCPASQRT